ncbi:unnamed protein product [Brassica rapa]|uniref:Uncharacterized protein n=1 Tax=Brassica campestris TaxID=3711 RepID=A0A8D9LX00_BRACM|nr:unnamed protein product [Brassica rapa]
MTQLQIQNLALSLFTIDEKAKRPRTSVVFDVCLAPGEAPVQVPDMVQAPGEQVEVVLVEEEEKD